MVTLGGGLLAIESLPRGIPTSSLAFVFLFAFLLVFCISVCVGHFSKRNLHVFSCLFTLLCFAEYFQLYHQIRNYKNLPFFHIKFQMFAYNTDRLPFMVMMIGCRDKMIPVSFARRQKRPLGVIQGQISHF